MDYFFYYFIIPCAYVVYFFLIIYLFSDILLYIYIYIIFWEFVASMSGVVLGGVVMVVGSNLARGKIFTAYIGSIDSLYPSVFIYCMNMHQFQILCSPKAMMFVKLYFRTSDIYLISLVSLDPSGFCSIEKERIYDV